MYQPVDFATPQIILAVAVILTVFAIPLGMHALYRLRKYRKDTENSRTYVRRRDIAIESSLAGIGLLMVLLCVVIAAVGWKSSAANLVANVQTRYVVTDVSMTLWNGSTAKVDLTDANGVRGYGIDVSFDAVGLPVLGEPAASEDGHHTVKLALNLR
ncbi:MAG: hypothetical protein ABWX63_05700 [Paeniglutamicibacter terrestris]